MNNSALDSQQIRLSDGRRLGFAQYGAAGGKPVIYCHGGLSSRYDISFADQICTDMGVRLLAVDRPGMGLSDHLPERSLRSFAADIEELASQLSIRNFPVLGWSLGGAYALVCGFALPHLVSMVGTVGGMGPADSLSLKQLGWVEDRLLLKCDATLAPILSAMLQTVRHMPPWSLDAWLVAHLHCERDRRVIREAPADFVAKFFREALRQGPAGVLADYKAVGSPWGFDLIDIKTKVIAWQGMQDNLCPLTMGQRYADQMADCQLIALPDYGHFLLHEKLEEVLDKLL